MLKNTPEIKNKDKISIYKLAEFIDYKEKEAHPEHKAAIEKSGMVTLYKDLYNPYSQVSHWTVEGVLRGHLNISTALITAFQSLLMLSKCINDKYVFGFDGELNGIEERFYNRI